MAFAPDAPLFVITALDRVLLYERSAGGPERRVGYHPSALAGVGLTADGRTVRTATALGVDEWDAADGRWLGARRDFRPAFEPGWPRDLPPVGPDGSLVPAAGELAVVLWPGRPPWRAFGGLPGQWRIQPDGRSARWDYGTLTCGVPCVGHAAFPLKSHPILHGAATALAAHGPRVLLATAGPGVGLFDGDAETLVAAAAVDGPEWTAAAFDPGGEVAVVGDAGGRLRVVRWPSPRPTSALPAHDAVVTVACAVGPGLVASGGKDGAVVLAELAGDELAVVARLPLGRPVRALSASADGRTLAVLCDGERSARVWRLDALWQAWAAAGLAPRPLPPPGGLPAPPSIPSPPAPPAGAVGGLWRVMYNGRCWENPQGGRVDPALKHEFWESPDPHVQAGNLSACWSGSLSPPAAGRYLFRARADDLVSVHVDDIQVASYPRWGVWPGLAVDGEVDLADRPHRFRVEYADLNGGGGWVNVEWSKPGPGGFGWRPIDPRFLAPHPPN